MNEGVWEDSITGEYWFEFEGSDSDPNYDYVAIEDPQPDNPPAIGALSFLFFPIGWKRWFKPVGPPRLARPPKLRRPKPVTEVDRYGVHLLGPSPFHQSIRGINNPAH